MEELKAAPLHQELEVAKLRLLLQQQPDLASLMAQAYLEENLTLQQQLTDLKTQQVVAEIRCCEAELNALRREMNAWAMYLVLLEQGVNITGFEGLTPKECRSRIIRLQVECQTCVSRATQFAARLGFAIRYDTEGGKVQLRLKVVEAKEVLNAQPD